MKLKTSPLPSVVVHKSKSKTPALKDKKSFE